ncbi:MAG: TRAP transporter small permease [Rhodobacteraceae bacterium]|nr:TRAP transporter small permease [Paracoccaceae bacterium]MBR9823589.1 TRAP transporter small permease [Paracoccaceae bacterium]
MQTRLDRFLLNLGAAAVLLLGTLITVNVLTRALFGISIPDSVTMVRELMVAAILLPLAQATAERAHVSVELLSKRLSPRGQSLLIILGSLIGLLALSPLLWAGWKEFHDTWTSGSFFSGEIQIPKWPGRLMFVLGVATCWLRLVWLAFDDARTVLRGGTVDLAQNTHEVE